MKQPKSDPEPTALNESQAVTGEDSPTGFAATSKSITAWTSNLLATAVVVMIALVAGSQLVSSFSPLSDALSDSSDLTMTADLANAWPTLESVALQFGDSNIQLQRDSLSGTREQVIAALESKCKNVLQRDSLPIGEFGDKESELVAELLDNNAVEPADQEPGHWRIFHIEKTENSSPLPLVIGIRDDIIGETTTGSAKPTSSRSSRLVVWGLAIPQSVSLKNDTTDTTGDTPKTPNQADLAVQGATGQWTSFIGSAVAESDLNRLKNDLIPATARRTIAIAGPNGGSLIGFSGGDVRLTTQFFEQLAAQRSWKTIQAWQHSAGSWSTRYELPQDSPVQGIQVQLKVNHNRDSPAETLRGILVIQSRAPLPR